MCGIIAVVDRTRAAVRPTIERMTGTLGHRVPDDTGVWQSPDGTVALGHCRLAVIDLSALGRNPMTLRQGRYWMTDPRPIRQLWATFLSGRRIAPIYCGRSMRSWRGRAGFARKAFER